jgi:chorismate mutase/prephenate dehydrogenase
MSTSAPHSENPPVRPLAVLRAMIDSIDHDILRLVGRRNTLVTEIAERRRRQHRPARDLLREREIIQDRRHRGQALGLDGDLVAGLFRLILRGPPAAAPRARGDSPRT